MIYIDKESVYHVVLVHTFSLWIGRLIVVAEKHTVYKEFPIPLINRLEKHFLTVNNIMTTGQLAIAEKLELWAKEFTALDPTAQTPRHGYVSL